MTANAESLVRFNATMREWAVKVVPEQAHAVQTAIGLEALSRVVLRTPVDTGRARGNWQVTLGSPATSDRETLDPAGTTTINEGNQVVVGAPPFSTIFLTNNVPQIEVLEHGGFIPANPDESEEARKRRRAGRSRRDRARALAAAGHEGAALVKDGYSLQAPVGMVSVAVEELLEVFR